MTAEKTFAVTTDLNREGCHTDHDHYEMAV